MRVVLNSLFSVNVSKRNSAYRYNLLLNETDNVLLSQYGKPGDFEFGTRMGLHLQTQYLRSAGLYMMYALAISYKGWFEIKWWYEREPRDQTEEFTWQISRPQLWGQLKFEFLIPAKENSAVVLEALAAVRYADLVKQISALERSI